MITATEHELPALRAGELESAPDAGLFALIDEWKQREKSRNELLNRLSIEEGEQIEAAAKNDCDAARAIYERIAAMKQFKGEHEIHREDAVLERPPSLDMSVVDRHE